MPLMSHEVPKLLEKKNVVIYLSFFSSSRHVDVGCLGKWNVYGLRVGLKPIGCWNFGFRSEISSKLNHDNWKCNANLTVDVVRNLRI